MVFSDKEVSACRLCARPGFDDKMVSNAWRLKSKNSPPARARSFDLIFIQIKTSRIVFSSDDCRAI